MTGLRTAFQLRLMGPVVVFAIVPFKRIIKLSFNKALFVKTVLGMDPNGHPERIEVPKT